MLNTPPDDNLQEDLFNDLFEATATDADALSEVSEEVETPIVPNLPTKVTVPEVYNRGPFGRLMEEEVNALSQGLNDPKRPLIAIVGGSKVSTKLDLLNNLVKKVDKLKCLV